MSTFKTFERDQASRNEDRANYTVHAVENLIVLADRNNGGRSVTRDVENVIMELRVLGYDVDQSVIVYRDTMGRWDQIITRKGKFHSFRSMGNPGDPAWNWLDPPR